MSVAIAKVPTASGSKYLQQLCKHWSHKLEVAFTAEAGTVTFPSGAVVTMTAHPDVLEVRIETPDAESLEQMKGVLERHLDRFAFREAPMRYEWG